MHTRRVFFTVIGNLLSSGGSSGTGGAAAAAPAGATAVSSSTFNAIQRYESFAAASYADNCTAPAYGSQVLQYFNASSTDTQATLFYAGFPNNEVVLSFRGSSSPIDLDTDLDYVQVAPTLSGVSCSGCTVHRGFQTAYKSVNTQILAATKASLSQHLLSTLVITGHSLGGGLAALATAEFAANGLSFKTYTFGEPRNGNAAWSNYVNSKQSPSNYFRVTHYNDGVPQIPPTILGFQHHGTEYWISQSTGNSASTTYNCGGGEPQSCNAAQDYGAGPINGAHISYLDLIASSLYNTGCGYAFPK